MPVNFQSVPRVWTGSKMIWSFYRISELMLATLVQRYDKIISFQDRETNWNFTGCQVPYFMIVFIPYIEDIQMFGVNMTFISSSEVKKLFHRVKWKNVYFMSAEGTNEIYIFFTSRDEIKVKFTTNIWIFFLLYTSLSIKEMQVLPLRSRFVWWR